VERDSKKATSESTLDEPGVGTSRTIDEGSVSKRALRDSIEDPRAVLASSAKIFIYKFAEKKTILTKFTRGYLRSG
jgi:hypothetical protein